MTHGHILFALLLAGCFLCGCNSTSSIRQRADAGDARAQYEYGRRLLTGQHVEKAPQLAPDWFRAAALQGHSKAQTALAVCYHHGLGIRQNEKSALEWCQRAAAQDEPHAIQMLMEWAAKQPTPQQSAKYLQPILDKRKPLAELYLATLYMKAKPAHTKHRRQAADYLRYAAIGGSGEAAFLLSLCYVDGCGVRPSPELAVGWLIQAAALGHEPAQYLLQELTHAQPEKA